MKQRSILLFAVLTLPWTSQIIGCGDDDDDSNSDTGTDTSAGTDTGSGGPDLSGLWEIVSIVDEGDAGVDEKRFKFILNQEEAGDFSMVFTVERDLLSLTGHLEGNEATLTFMANFSGEEVPLNILGTMSNDYVMSGVYPFETPAGPMTVNYTMTRLSPSTEIPSFELPVAPIVVDGNRVEWETVPASAIRYRRVKHHFQEPGLRVRCRPVGTNAP